jgi:hypothetical protein
VEVVPAPDGEYSEAEGNRIIVVADGKVSEIREKGEELERAPVSAPVPHANPVRDLPLEPETPVETADEPQADPADENDEEEAEAIEDRVARLEARLAEFTEGLEAILNGIANLEARIEAVEAKVAGLEEPGADSAEKGEDFSEQKPKSRLALMKKK